MHSDKFKQEEKVLIECRALMKARNYSEPSNFYEFADIAREIILVEGKIHGTQKWKSLAEGLARLRSDYNTIVERDPMIQYRPQHSVAMDFHKSDAYTRVLCTANRCSKTTMCAAELRWYMTNTHPYRKTPLLPMQSFTVGLSYAQYATTVWEPKMIDGEPGNPLSPIFPEDGKWFNHYDERKHKLTIGCAACANAGKAKQCKHAKSWTILFSDEAGAKNIAGGQYGFTHLDEEVGTEFFKEGQERLKAVPHSAGVISYTPLQGESFWTELLLRPKHLQKLMVPGTKRRVVEFFSIDQYQAGLVPYTSIDASLATLPLPQVKSRIFGIPAAASEFVVFNQEILERMMKGASDSEKFRIQAYYE